MKYNKLKLNVVEKKYKPTDMPPLHSEYFTQLVLAKRGQGKTYTTLEFLDNLERFKYYNIYFLISSTYKSDVKVNQFYNDLERKGYLVFRYKKFNKGILKEINNIMKDLRQQHENYILIKNLIEKVRRKNMNFNEEELQILNSYILEDVDIENLNFNDLKELLKEFPETIRREAPPSGHILIDDFMGCDSLTKTKGVNPFQQLWIKHRHKGLSLTVLLQGLQNLPKSIRANTVLWVIFPSKSERDMKVMYEENDGLFRDYKQFEDIMDDISKKEYNFLYLDTSHQTKAIIKSGWNDIINLDDY